MPASQVTAPLTQSEAYRLVDAVMEDGDLALTASAHEDEETGAWYFEATCAGEPDLAAFSVLAQRILKGTIAFDVEPIDEDTDWVSRSLEGLAPVVAGRFYVYGSHEPLPPPAGFTPMLIDAAQAFGTGHHETTTGCLEAIDQVLRRRRFSNPIDVGSGTGVLAIAIAKRLRRPVLATDIDPVATRTAADNAAANGVARLVRTVTATGLSHPVIATGAPYDLIVANILAGPLVALAPSMARAAAPKGTLILSGILARQANRVVNAYRSAGFTLLRKLDRRGWTTLILERR